MPNLRHGNTRLLGFLHHCSLLLVGEAAGSIARPLTLPPILLSQGDLYRRLLRGAGGTARQGCCRHPLGRLKDGWLDEYAAWRKRDLSAKRYVYIWADGIHLEARLEDEKQCIQVMIGATPEGRKELAGFTDGARESAHDWRDLLLDLKRRGLDVSPRLVIARRRARVLEGRR